MKRTERFMMPVSLSEEEKRNSRAERFGTASAADGLDSSKQSEEGYSELFTEHDEYEKLIKIMNPPKVVIDNEFCKNATVIQVDSANKHGILLEVVQILTDLNLVVTKAYICSDGGWFMDEKEADPDRKLSFTEFFAKTRKHKPGRIYKSNPDVMQFRIDTIKCHNIGEICATISRDTVMVLLRPKDLALRVLLLLTIPFDLV